MSLTISLLAMGSFKIQAEVVTVTGQQSDEYVSLMLEAVFDDFNFDFISFMIPQPGDHWFDNLDEKLYTFGSTDWDDGTVLPVEEPGSPVDGARWFNPANKYLYTYYVGWDFGTPTSVGDAPSEGNPEYPYEGLLWFVKATDTLYTYSGDAWDEGVVIATSQPGEPSVGERWYDENADTLYTYLSEWQTNLIPLPTVNPAIRYGQKLSLNGQIEAESGYRFLYWAVNDSIKTFPVDHEFSLTKTNQIKAVFAPENKYVVTFVDANSKILKIEYVSPNEDATEPETLPDKPGHELAENHWSVSLTQVNEDRVAVLQYVPTETAEYTVTVENGSGSGNYTFNTVATITADPYYKGARWFDEENDLLYTFVGSSWNAGEELPTTMPEGEGVYEGARWFDEDEDMLYTYSDGWSGEAVSTVEPIAMVFHHWEIDSRTVSYQATYAFTVFDDVTVTAYYSSDAPEDLPRITLSDDLGIRSEHRTFVGQFYLPSGYELIEFGMLTATTLGYLDLDAPQATRNPGNKYNGATNEFVMSFATSQATYVRAYMVCRNPMDQLITVYDMPSHLVINGDFETGTMFGWDGYGIWKDESGMQAFLGQPRVVSGTYFDSNPYHRDGSYNLGIVWSGASWDQSAERMGHLRSSDFTLGGSGWISFKLGAGKVSSTAYVSVRRTSDNIEIARFGNKNYNNTGKATDQYGSSISNAEAFMFQYFYDLSDVGVIGESYYFVISETSSWDWCILSADAFITYYPTDPTVDYALNHPSVTMSDVLASNIVPVILPTDSANPNSIRNGYFDTNMDYWSIVDNNWYYSSNHYAKSNSSVSGGDAGMGVLRSSAFTVTDKQYIRFDWAGGLKNDKQIFISIKEVGTNIEVLRFVRRDNLSGKESDGFDNHMLDLSSLDQTKEYYLEFADNKSGGWGVSFVDSIRLVPKSEWDSVTSGDRAVKIATLETEFFYQKP